VNSLSTSLNLVIHLYSPESRFFFLGYYSDIVDIRVRIVPSRLELARFYAIEASSFPAASNCVNTQLCTVAIAAVNKFLLVVGD